MFAQPSRLEKERDFLQLNKELGEKVKSLILDVDSIISNQEDVMRIPKITSSQWLNRNKLHSKPAISEACKTQLDDEFIKLNKDNLKG